MHNFRFAAPVFALLASAAVMSGCTDDATLKVDNQSDFSIVDLRVAPVGTTTWGANLLSDGDLQPGETITLGVSCDTYDAQLIDETNVTCTIQDLDLCANDSLWVIRNDTCTAFQAAAKARAAAKAAAQGSAPAAQ
jgi:hypothetical protein